MKKFIGFFKGKKTYILAGIGGIVFVFSRLGYIDTGLEGQIYTALGLGSVVTIRAGIKNK